MLATLTKDHLVSNLPASRFGHSTGLNCFDGSELLVAMKCYFDGSEGTDTSGDTWLTLAGFAATDKSWGGFEGTWNTMLRERYPIAPYVHMWQIISGTDPFERVNGWTKGRVVSLVSDAVELLKNRDSLHAFSCRVNISARQRIIDEGHSVYEPARLCAEMCHSLSRRWSLTKKLELVWLFFDRGESFIKPLKDQWLANRTPPNKLATDPEKRVWDLIANIVDDDTEHTPGLQAADMVAWATSRDLAKKLEPLYDLNQYMNDLNVEYNAVIDEPLLRKLYLID
jgi:hypothetical protein